jgi:hypothetical protein
MLNHTQAKLNELSGKIAQLETEAKAERLADVAGMENHWRGQGEALAEARAEYDRLIEKREAEVFADDCRRYANEIERRAALGAQIAELDAKIATFSEQTRDYFRAANDIMRWTERATSSGPHFHTSATQRDAFGNVLDVPPLDHLRRPVVPEGEWPAVQEIRDLYNKRAAIGQGLSGMDSSLRDMIAKNPALAYVTLKGRQFGPSTGET